MREALRPSHSERPAVAPYLNVLDFPVWVTVLLLFLSEVGIRRGL
jgi:hypothetical protein